jgi:hypothetical protein
MGGCVSNITETLQEDNLLLLNAEIKSYTDLLKTIVETKELINTNNDSDSRQHYFELLYQYNMKLLQQLHRRKTEYLIKMNINRYNNDKKYLKKLGLSLPNFLRSILFDIPLDILQLIMGYILDNYNIILVHNVTRFYKYNLWDKITFNMKPAYRMFVYDPNNKEWREIPSSFQDSLGLTDIKLKSSNNLFLDEISSEHLISITSL